MRVFLYAYDKINLGDDLFVRKLVERYKKARFYFFAEGSNKAVFPDFKNLKIINRSSGLLGLLWRLHPALGARYEHFLRQRCDAVCYIGGSIFEEYPSWESMLNWWTYLAEEFPFYVLGANFGPYKTEGYLEGLKKALMKAADVSFRDKYSFFLFSDCKPARYAPDILFLTQFAERDPEKQVFISVISCASRNHGLFPLDGLQTSYTDSLKGIIGGFLSLGYKIILSSFCEAEGDRETLKPLLDEFSGEAVSELSYNGRNSAELLNAINASSLIVASRFHAAVLGLAAKRAVYPIVYSDKTLNLLSDIGFKGNIADIRKCNASFAAAAENLNCKMPDTAALQLASEQHFERLDSLLKGENK